MKLPIIIVIIAILLSINKGVAQTPTDFYPIVMINTSDASIGGAVVKQKLERMFDDISTATSMTKHLTIIQDSFKFSDFETAVNNIPDNDNSVVFLYVYGFSNVVDLEFPIITFRERDKKFSDMHYMLKERGNRLTVSIIEACNIGGSQANLTTQTALTDFYKELFSDAKGDVIAYSSKKGQSSLASSKGGNFGNILLANITGVGDWNKLAQKVNAQTKAEAEKYTCDDYPVACNCENDRCSQEPYWEINTSLGESCCGCYVPNTPIKRKFSYKDKKYKYLNIPEGIPEIEYRVHQFEYQLMTKNVSEADIKKILKVFME